MDVKQGIVYQIFTRLILSRDCSSLTFSLCSEAPYWIVGIIAGAENSLNWHKTSVTLVQLLEERIYNTKRVHGLLLEKLCVVLL